ncbi:MAG: PfkB family carbohydrate kinase [Candidatus Paceibacterota bacterium]|jgi:sugar/nucleoside kinase (ribokinase family)
MKKIDFLGIGDIVTDAFIRLKDASVHCNIDQKNCELCLRFGDKIPYESLNIIHASGNSGNAVISASRLGLNSAIVTNIGNDQNGKDCLESFKKNKVKTDFVKIEKNKNTNYNYILWYETERTILTKHTEFNYVLPKLPEVSWIYFSSLGENSLPYHLEISEFLKNHPETKLAFQPGTFQMKLGTEKLKDIYAQTEIFFCNLEEAQRILNQENKNVLELSKGIKALGPKMVAISDGLNGAYFYFKDELWHLPIYPNENSTVESTGAGDAFSSTFTSALALGKNPLEAFSWSLINSMSVVQKIGAHEGLLTREKLEEYLKNAPENYKIKKL